MNPTMKKIFRSLWVVALLILLAACGSANATEEAEESIPVVADDFAVIAEGRVLPHQFVNLAFGAGGQVLAVLVGEGEQVEAGQELARLGDTLQLESAVAAAELEVLNAEKVIDDLMENADLVAAQALVSMANAQDAVRDAERRVANLHAPSRQTDIDTAKSNVVILKDRLDKADDAFEPYRNKPENNLTRAALQTQMADAQARYDSATRLLNNLLGTANEIEFSIADAEMINAKVQLLHAEQTYQNVESGPDPVERALAQARLQAAEAALAAAADKFLDNILTAPFAGTVVGLDIKAGEHISPGQSALVLADFSQWLVETDNLTEIEVVEVMVGQKVTITPDALPELSLAGKVDSISNMFEEKRGDITYTTLITLEEYEELLRWGMTVVVTFDNQ